LEQVKQAVAEQVAQLAPKRLAQGLHVMAVVSATWVPAVQAATHVLAPVVSTVYLPLAQVVQSAALAHLAQSVLQAVQVLVPKKNASLHPVQVVVGLALSQVAQLATVHCTQVPSSFKLYPELQAVQVVAPEHVAQFCKVVGQVVQALLDK
jgi:hypothetical protein